MPCSLNHFCRFPIPRRVVALIMLTVLAWSIPSFCGEIHDAAKQGDLARIQSLLQRSPDLVFSKDDRGNTPLFWAASGGYANVVELLLASGADVNARTDDGMTPLHEASGGGYADVVKLLLANKADVNAKANKGFTPLHDAAGLGHKGVVELLLDNGANMSAKDNQGRTALDYAAHNGHADVEELLRQHGGLGEIPGQRALEPPSSQSASSSQLQDLRPVIYIFRPPRFKASGLDPAVLCDGVTVGEMFSGTYLTVRVSPGKHVITATGKPNSKQGSIELDAVSGGIYYIEFSVVLGPKVTLALVSKEIGESEISKKCKPITPFVKEPRAAKPNSSGVKATSDDVGPSAAQAPAAALQPPPVLTYSPAVAPLTDAQVKAAIQRGIDDKHFSIADHAPTVVINKLGPVNQLISVFSDSDRIALAASVASHNVDERGRRSPRQTFSFTVEDAKASAVVLGVTTLVIEFVGEPVNLAKSLGPSYHIALNADGKVIEPITNAQYFLKAVVPAAPTLPLRRWNYQDYFTTQCIIMGIGGLYQKCSYSQVMFPVIEGVHKLTVITTSANGNRKEKEVNPKLFEER